MLVARAGGIERTGPAGERAAPEKPELERLDSRGREGLPAIIVASVPAPPKTSQAPLTA
jgi:hypothetical protein